MGEDKALLPLGKTNVLEFLIARLQRVCDEVMLVTTPTQSYPHVPLRKFFDVVSGKFSLGGLYSGLLQSPATINFVCGCDMPLLEPELVRALVASIEGYDAVVPQVRGFFEPLCAVYSRACLPFIETQLRTEDLRMTSWLTHARVRIVSEQELRAVDPELRSLMNMNTRADYERMQMLLAE